MKNQKEKLRPFEQAWMNIKTHHLLGALTYSVGIRAVTKEMLFSHDMHPASIASVNISGDNAATIYLNKELRLTKQEWEFVFACVLVFLGFGLYKKISSKEKEVAAFLFAIYYVYSILDMQEIPAVWSEYEKLKFELSFKNENSIFEQLTTNDDWLKKAKTLSLIQSEQSSFIFGKEKVSYYGWKQNMVDIFTENLVKQAQKTIALRGNIHYEEDNKELEKLISHKAKRWFINHYPLLSGLAATFKIVEDIKICQRLDIQIAAVSVEDKTIYINPLAALNEQGMRFVMAHEFLHVALNHASRRQGRDHLTWNLACDFVINHWLVQMNIGIAPHGVYFDNELAGKSADEIYIMINQDLRLRKKMGTLRDLEAGHGKTGADMLDKDVKYFGAFEDACKEALCRGMFLHQSMGRGDLPADLIEEIRALNQPPIPWQVELARWIAERFPLEESKKTYARPSRRQSATPDIPRARYIRPQEDKMTRTFGVIMDTSGSMNKELLGKCLGAISSYCAAQEIHYVRLIFCDAQPYDEGFVPVELLAHKIKVKGRGGTVIQQAVNYLQNVSDFPQAAPILILTDGYIEDDLEVQRDHAFMVPNRHTLPFIPHGPVFEFK